MVLKPLMGFRIVESQVKPTSRMGRSLTENQKVFARSAWMLLTATLFLEITRFI